VGWALVCSAKRNSNHATASLPRHHLVCEIKMIGIFVAVFVLLLGFAVVRAMSTGQKAPVSGAPAPDFTLNSQDGKPLSLHDLRGKWVVLYFYPKDFTSGCTREAHNFQRDLTQYEQKN